VKLVFEADAWEHLLFWQESNKATVKKINALIKECLRHPFDGTGKPEPLKGDLTGYWSRRIDREHRLVYRVKEGALEILSCRYHYSS
jgi:toxin YoeB